MNGLLAEFRDAAALRDAAQAARAAGYVHLSAYAPHAVAGLDSALALKRPRIGLCMIAGALFGGGGTYFMEWYSSVVAYPIDVGGRPLASWPLFVPPAAEMTLLFAALVGVAAFLYGCRLPSLHDPLWDIAAFARASDNRYFLWFGADDARFDADALRTWLTSTASACAVHEVGP